MNFFACNKTTQCGVHVSTLGIYWVFRNSWLMASHKCLFFSNAAIVRGFGSLLSFLRSGFKPRDLMMTASADTDTVFAFFGFPPFVFFLFFAAGCPSSEQWQDGRWSSRCFTNGSQFGREQQFVYSPIFFPVARTVMQKNGKTTKKNFKKSLWWNFQMFNPSQKRVCGLFEK